MRRIAVLASLLAALSSLLPPGAGADSWAQKYYYRDITYPFFVPDPARPGWYRSDRPGSYELSFSAVKSTDVFRVFVLGGAIAKLLRMEEKDSDGLAKALQAALPSRTVEVLNCGMMGYDSFREALLEQELLEYSPDLLVFLPGHYEGIAPSPVPIPTWIMDEKERLARLSAYRAFVATDPPADAQGEYTAARVDALDAAFAANLAANLRRARERGVRAAVVVPPRNYREPVELDRMLYDAEFVPGWLSFLRGDYAGARRLWKETLADAQTSRAGSHEAFTWGFIARAEEKLGMADEARASFERTAVHDRSAICGAACQAIIRRAAGQEGAILVEADRMFRALTHPRMPGMELFNERKNWKPQFGCLIMSELIESVRRDPRLGALKWDDARAREFKAACRRPDGRGTLEDDLLVMSYVLVELSRPDFSRLSTLLVFYIDAISRYRAGWFRELPALLKKTKAAQAAHAGPMPELNGIPLAPDAVLLPRLYWHVGEARMLEKDYDGATAYFSKALELDPALAWARISLAVAEALRGDKKRGLEALKDAIARSTGYSRRGDILASASAIDRTLALGGGEAVAGGDPVYWLNKAETAVSSGTKSEGLAALRGALAASPRPDQLRLIGQYYRMLGEPGKFLEISGALTAAFPQDADVWLMTADAAFKEKRAEAGLEALARAERLQPDAGQKRQIAELRRRLKSGDPAGPAEKAAGATAARAPAGPDPEPSLKEAKEAVFAGDKPKGLSALARARTMPLRPDQLRRVGQYYRQLREDGKFLEMSAALGEAYPADADVWLMISEASFLEGRREAGLAALARAEKSLPDPAQRRQISVWRGRAGTAAPREAAAASDSDPDFWLGKAEAAAAAGRKPEGLSALERARTLSPRPDQLRRIAQYYRVLGDGGKFLELSDALAAAFPKDADVWLMIAEASITQGRAAAGSAALERAKKLSPSPAQIRQIEAWTGRLKGSSAGGKAPK